MAIAATLTLSPGTVPVREGVAAVHSVLDTIDIDDLTGTTARDLREIDRARARLDALRLAAIAQGDREGAGARTGMSSTSAWVATTTRIPGARAAADVALATALDDSLPVTKQALADGDLSADHASIIAGTASRLPAGLTDEERSRVEHALVAQAKHVDPAKLRRSARRALEAAERSAREVLEHEDAELRGEEARALAKVRLTLHDNRDGTMTGHFTVPTVAGAILRKAIQQMVSPRRNRTDGADGGSGASSSVVRGSSGSARSGVADIDWAHRSGQAFVELLEHLPTDRLHGKVAATVVVTVDVDRLREGVGSAHLDSGHDLSAGEARRLACAAGILPAVLDGSSLPLDLGRTHRFFSENQRVALATTYDECAVEGCDRPYAWSELHHEDAWADGGATDLHLAVPACGFHHRRVHDPRYAHTISTDDRGRKTLRLRRAS